MALKSICTALAAIMAVAAMTVPACAADYSCAPSFADLENPVPAHFSEEAITLLKESYRTPEIRGLRSGINAYLAGDADETTTRSLRMTARSVLHRRFRLFYDNRGVAGGYFLTVQFVGHPEAMYRAWVYDIGDAWQVRAWEKAACSAAEQRWLRIRYSDLSNMAASG